MTYTLHTGDCRDVMATLPAESVDAIVCDPPYGLSFMGKGWDHGVPGVDFWVEALRVLKPGGHLIAFGGTRTYHRLAVAIEDAGFEVRDCLMWLYGGGFPKSLDVSKATDKQNGKQRRPQYLRFTEWMRSTGITAKQINEITDSFMGSHYLTDREQPAVPTEEMFSKLRPHLPTVPDDIEELVRMRTVEAENFKSRKVVSETRVDMFGEYEVQDIRRMVDAQKARPGIPLQQNHHKMVAITSPSTDLAKEWHGWGTALKPAYEPAILARKPLRGTVADNVAQWGVGGLNIDGCRVGDKGGRWPANVILDEEAAAALDAQSGVTRGSKPNPNVAYGDGKSANDNIYGKGLATSTPSVAPYSDTGGASRFFYTAKASRSEREAGLDGVEAQRANHHPTVKPIALMRYMIRLVAPRGAVVLDPFMGSGSTGCAAMVEGMQFVGIDITPEYVDIARRRIAWWSCSLDGNAIIKTEEDDT
jgi:site-specific DNA-methyltransferase (adenine-specific)